MDHLSESSRAAPVRILTVVGARPQFIKAAVVSRAVRDTPGVEEVLVHTGQHYDENMSEVFFREMEIPAPAHHLGVGSGPHGEQTGRMLEAVERVMQAEQPDCVLVYGDTNSTLAAALSAVKLQIPLMHVEAGVRAFNLRMPEEVNRLCADHLSDLLFVPTQAAVENLRREGFAEDRIRHVGDVMYDAALHYGAVAEATSRVLDRVGLGPRGYVLATIHRPENTDDPERLRNVFVALATITARYPVVLPLHPRTRGALQRAGLLEGVERDLRVIEPVSYLDMVTLEKHARLVVSDSGGVPKEAFFYGVPSVILRRDAVWVELVELGWTAAVEPVTVEAAVAGIEAALASPGGRPGTPYGDGTSGSRIVADIIRHVRGR